MNCALLPKMQLAMKAVPGIHREGFSSTLKGSHPMQLHQGDRLLAESTGTLHENKLRLFIQSCVCVKLGKVEPWENCRQGKDFWLNFLFREEQMRFMFILANTIKL